MKDLCKLQMTLNMWRLMEGCNNPVTHIKGQINLIQAEILIWKKSNLKMYLYQLRKSTYT